VGRRVVLVVLVAGLRAVVVTARSSWSSWPGLRAAVEARHRIDVMDSFENRKLAMS
jgi:hypothetical protein